MNERGLLALITNGAKVILFFSGGKDSLACLFRLLELGVPKEQIELWHQDVDGNPIIDAMSMEEISEIQKLPLGEQRKIVRSFPDRCGHNFFDWPCTPAYCQAIADTLGIPLYFSWQKGGFEWEMLRDNEPPTHHYYEAPEGLRYGGGKSKIPVTRLMLPQTGSMQQGRWCTAKLKISPSRIAFNQQDRFVGATTIIVSGERADESTSRRGLSPIEAFASHGKRDRVVWHWRLIHSWSERQVWDIIQSNRFYPHPVYYLGADRASCQFCIFASPNLWATNAAIAPERYAKIVEYEKQFGVTLRKGETIPEWVERRGTIYPNASDFSLVSQLLDTEWHTPLIVDDWQLPAGAFTRENAGPS